MSALLKKILSCIGIMAGSFFGVAALLLMQQSGQPSGQRSNSGALEFSVDFDNQARAEPNESIREWQPDNATETVPYSLTDESPRVRPAANSVSNPEQERQQALRRAEREYHSLQLVGNNSSRQIQWLTGAASNSELRLQRLMAVGTLNSLELANGDDSHEIRSALTYLAGSTDAGVAERARAALHRINSEQE